MSHTLAAGALALLLAVPGATFAQETLTGQSQPLAEAGSQLAPPLPPLDLYPVQLVLDDDTAEATTGVIGAGGARQFLWFNRFASPGGFYLEQIWVLFPTGANMSVGAAVDLVVYQDPDGNPANGATLLSTIPATIDVLDGVTFSVYDVVPPLAIPAGGDVLIGVVNRFVTSGVTPVTLPAAIDTNSTQQRSWIASWVADPPAPPGLPSDGTMLLIDDLLPSVAGNWMIRGFGTPLGVLEVPTLDGAGLFVLAGLLVVTALFALRSAQRRD